MEESDDDIRDLHARIVDVILHFHALSGAAQHAHQRIAQRGVAQVADMRGLIRIDVGVFHDAFGRIGSGAGGLRFRFLQRGGEKRGPRKIKIHVAAAGDFHALDAFDGRKLRGDFLRDLPRSAFQALGQLEAHGRGDFAHLDAGRFLRDDGHVLLVVLADMRREGGANAGYENVYQVAPICEEKQRL